MKIQKIIPIILIVSIIFSILPSTVIAAEKSKTYKDSELARAVSLGIGTYAKYETITYKKFFGMLDEVVKLANPLILAKWKKRLLESRKSSKTMKRDEGMLAIFYAADTLGTNYYSYNSNGDYWIELSGEAVWKEM